MTKQRAKASFAGIVLFLFASTLAAQVTEEWVARYDGPNSFGDFARAIAVDNEGNVYVTGESDSTGNYDGWYDCVTIKYSPDGKEEWVRRYNGPSNYYDGGTCIAVDDAGNVYVAGASAAVKHYTDYLLIKYNPEGGELWVARYDSPGNGEDDVVTSMVLDDEGNIYVTGGSGQAYATVKYDTSGKEQWVARYDILGGASAIALDDSSNIYVTGTAIGTEWDCLTIKYNSLGEKQWVSRYNGPGNSYDGSRDIAVDNEGNVYITGHSTDLGLDIDYITIKYNSFGEEQWTARYKGPVGNSDFAKHIALDGEGNVYVTGFSLGSDTCYDYATVKYSPDGVEEWVDRYNGTGNEWDEATSMAMDTRGNVYITGFSRNTEGYFDYVTIKYNPDGKREWIARYDGDEALTDEAYAIAVDDEGCVYVTGFSLASEGRLDYTTVKYSQGPAVAEAPPDVPGHRLEVAQLAPEPVITYTLPSSSSISLKVYDVTGKLVRTLVSGSQETGTHTVTWDGRDDAGRKLSSGLYFIRIAAPGFSRFAKVVMLR